MSDVVRSMGGESEFGSMKGKKGARFQKSSMSTPTCGTQTMGSVRGAKAARVAERNECEETCDLEDGKADVTIGMSKA